MSAGLMGWRPLGRLAWREVVRRRGRTALVVTMVAVPMMMLTALSVWTRTDTVDGARANQLSLGPTVDVRVSPGPGAALRGPQYDPTAVESLAPILSSGATSVEVKAWAQGLFVSTQTKLGLGMFKSDWANPLLTHSFLLRSGVWPKASGEGAVTKSLLRAAGAVLVIFGGCSARPTSSAGSTPLPGAYPERYVWQPGAPRATEPGADRSSEPSWPPQPQPSRSPPFRCPRPKVTASAMSRDTPPIRSR